MVSLCDIHWENFNKLAKFVKMARVQRVNEDVPTHLKGILLKSKSLYFSSNCGNDFPFNSGIFGSFNKPNPLANLGISKSEIKRNMINRIGYPRQWGTGKPNPQRGTDK
jgi:hypothetical protein